MRPGGWLARGGNVVPLALGLVCAVLVAAGFGFGVYLPNLHNGLIAATFAAVGVLVLRRRPGNREAWLFVATGLAHAVMFFGRQYGFYAADHPGILPAAPWVLWVGVWPLALVLVLVGITLMCFPDGRLPSPRWRIAVAVMLAVGALLSVASALWPVNRTDNSLDLPHPWGVPGYETAQALWNISSPPAFLLFQVAWVIAVVVRLRRATGDEAKQLRWFAYAVTLSAVAMVAGLVAFGTPTLGVLAVPVVPLAAGAAIVKYRLYDIDLLIHKTFVLGAMATVITAGYVGVVVVVGRLAGNPVGRDPLLPLVATTLVAIAFEPARRRVRALADRLVYGDRPSPYDALARLSTEVSHLDRRADVFSAMAATIADAVGAADVTVWVGAGDQQLAMASWPPRGTGEPPLTASATTLASLADGERRAMRPIVYQGLLRGAVTLTKKPGESLTAGDDRLLHDLVAQAGLVIDNVDLGTELEQRLHQISVQAADLQAAARRIVTAQDEARMRIERDLHDGAQQHLVTLALGLQAVADRARSAEDGHLTAQIEASRHQLSQALVELRELARGIHPAILTQEGLAAAVHFLGERAPLPVTVDLRLGARLSPEVEATAYFVVSEALTNAAKHAQASDISVQGSMRNGALHLEISDNGRGGAEGHWGSGLQGLVDRIATLNGRLTVHSPVGGGTRLCAEIPCG